MLKDMTWATSNTATIAEQVNTWLNITGSGYISGWVGDAASDLAIQVDGGAIRHIRIPGDYAAWHYGFWRFKSSLKVTCSRGAGVATQMVVLLD